MKKESKKVSNGVATLIICGIIAIALIIVCVFFPDEFFGLFTK